jgi:hypothetical protein
LAWSFDQRAVANGPNAFFGSFKDGLIGVLQSVKTPEIGLLVSHSDFGCVLTFHFLVVATSHSAGVNFVVSDTCSTGEV